MPQNAHWFSNLTVHPSRILAARTLAAMRSRIEKGLNRASALGELSCRCLRCSRTAKILHSPPARLRAERVAKKEAAESVKPIGGARATGRARISGASRTPSLYSHRMLYSVSVLPVHYSLGNSGRFEARFLLKSMERRWVRRVEGGTP